MLDGERPATALVAVLEQLPRIPRRFLVEQQHEVVLIGRALLQLVGQQQIEQRPRDTPRRDASWRACARCTDRRACRWVGSRRTSVRARRVSAAKRSAPVAARPRPRAMLRGSAAAATIQALRRRSRGGGRRPGRRARRSGRTLRHVPARCDSRSSASSASTARSSYSSMNSSSPIRSACSAPASAALARCAPRTSANTESATDMPPAPVPMSSVDTPIRDLRSAARRAALALLEHELEQRAAEAAGQRRRASRRPTVPSPTTIAPVGRANRTSSAAGWRRSRWSRSRPGTARAAGAGSARTAARDRGASRR